VIAIIRRRGYHTLALSLIAGTAAVGGCGGSEQQGQAARPSPSAASDRSGGTQAAITQREATVRTVQVQAPAGTRRERILRLRGLTLFGACRLVAGNANPLLSITARTSVDNAILASHFGQQGHGSPTYTFVLDDFEQSDGPRDVLGTNPDATVGTVNYSRPDGGQVALTFVADEKAAQGACAFGGAAQAGP
jgi:hypothetical protein